MLRKIKKEIQPTPEFVEKTRGRFLAMYETQYPNAAKRSSSWHIYVMRAGAVVAACAVVITATSAYADQSNVSAASPLYPLKRISESVRLAVSTETKKQEVYTELAERRVQEIEEDVKLSKESKSELATDANAELKRSLRSLPASEPANSPMSVPTGTPDVSPTPPTLSPSRLPKESDDGEIKIKSSAEIKAKIKIEDEDESTVKSNEEDGDGDGKKRKVREEYKQCKTLERAIENKSLWSQIGDEELEKLFDEKCSE